MRKALILLIGLLLLGGLAASVDAQVNDAPHNVSNSINCSDCHGLFSIGSYTDAVCLSCHGDNTGGPYTKNSAPEVQTHSSANTSTKYGTWTRDCMACHFRQAAGIHGQLQRFTYGAQTFIVTGTITSVTVNPDGTRTYGYNNLVENVNLPGWSDPARWGSKSNNKFSGANRGLIFYKTPVASTPVASEVISADSTSITVTGNPGTVSIGNTFALIYGQFVRSNVIGAGGANRTVKFLNNEGADSFAFDESATGTDPNPDGICQVCHTQTQHWRADGTLAGVGVHAGQNGANCMQCHKHEEGFKAAGCNTCHGFPPIDASSGGPTGLVNNPAPTNSATAGAHNIHVSSLSLDCEACHYNSKGAGPTHNDGTVQAITMGFYLFSGAVQGGNYDGQSGVDYNTSVPNTSPATSVSPVGSGAQQCSNLYCHSIGQGDGGVALTSGDYKTPMWSGSVICGDCHKSDGAQGTMTYMDSGSHLPHLDGDLWLTCSECHNGAGTGTMKHANNLIEISFNGNPFGHTSTYSQSPNTPGLGYGSCSTVYCHSIGQGAGGVPLVAGTSDYKNPSWGGTTLCDDCHGANLTSGSHPEHLSAPFSYNCITCHNNAGPGSTVHADMNVDMEFGGQSGGVGTYSQNPNPVGNGYGNCSTTYCHGTASPQWGTDLSAVAACEKCHGSAATAAGGSFKDTAGNISGSAVGAHVAHLASTHNYTLDIACNQCHAVPASVIAAGHIDSALPADISWGLLATKNGAVTPSYAGATCSATYCHGTGIDNGYPGGNNKNPGWADTSYLMGVPSFDCAQCHGYPPGGAHPAATPSTCKDCHPGVNPTGTGFTDPTTHVNGILEATGGDDCTSCHTDAGLSASHLKHSSPETVMAGKKLSLGDYGQAWFYDVSYVSGVPKFSCGYCHSNNEATHRNSAINLNLDPGDAAAAGTVKEKNGYPDFVQNSGTSVTCSSVYCHGTGYDDGTGYYYQTSPDWYGGSFAGDKCSNCHGNSPNTGGKPGSLSHYNPDAMGMGVVGGHFVGIHYKNVFTGTTGVIKDASLNQNAHGNAATSTTISCNTCHSLTVTVPANDLNQICAACHGAGAEQGTMMIDPLSTVHIDGTPQVAFEASIINSKAQIRDDITTVSELDTNWTRIDGYKQQPTSKDSSVQALNLQATYNPGDKSCSSVACHNGNTAQWGTPNVTCNSCHTSLP